jgi:SAM-dependent methyltransferase
VSDRSYWERHATHYDSSLRILGRPFPRMLELTCDALRGRERVLEVAAGTGLVTRAIAGVAGEVTATDYASAMVDLLIRRVNELGLRNVHCEQADIYALRFKPASSTSYRISTVLWLRYGVSSSLAASSSHRPFVTTKPGYPPSCLVARRSLDFRVTDASPRARYGRLWRHRERRSTARKLWGESSRSDTWKRRSPDVPGLRRKTPPRRPIRSLASLVRPHERFRSRRSPPVRVPRCARRAEGAR